MNIGIYYAYWEKKWGADYIPYIKKVKNLGFDLLEISCAGLIDTPDSTMLEMKRLADENGIILTSGYGPDRKYDISSKDPDTVRRALDFYENTFKKLALADIHFIGGAIYSYWPVDYSENIDKPAVLARSISGMKKLARIAAKYDITIGCEILNRFENFLLNTAEEGILYCRAVGEPNVKVMLDTFHMNIEEDSMGGAILACGKELLGHVHIGECNRRLPGQGRMIWDEIADALHTIGYDGNVVMEPFVLDGGQVGQDVKVWRDLSDGADISKLDKEAADAVKFIKSKF